MALASRNEVETVLHGHPCSIAVIYDTVADDQVELAELNKLLYDEGNSQGQVFRYLTHDGGFKVGFQSINRHRGGRCRCFREERPQFCGGCKRDLPSCVCDAR